MKPANLEKPELLDLTVSECLDAWIASKMFIPLTERKYRQAMHRFIEHTNDATIKSIKRSDVADFVARLAALPTATTLSPARKSTVSMQELVALRQEWLRVKPRTVPATQWPLISQTTVNRHLETLKAMFAWVAEHNSDFMNPARDVKRC